MKQRKREWFDAPPRDLYTAADAQRVLGINARRVRNWALREKVSAVGLTADGRHMYDKNHLVALRDAAPVRRVA